MSATVFSWYPTPHHPNAEYKTKQKPLAEEHLVTRKTGERKICLLVRCAWHLICEKLLLHFSNSMLKVNCDHMQSCKLDNHLMHNLRLSRRKRNKIIKLWKEPETRVQSLRQLATGNWRPDFQTKRQLRNRIFCFAVSVGIILNWRN